jgi:hypothetical protein
MQRAGRAPARFRGADSAGAGRCADCRCRGDFPAGFAGLRKTVHAGNAHESRRSSWPLGFSPPSGHINLLVQVLVDANGSVADAWTYASSGSKLIDAAVLDAVRQSKYAAGTAFCVPAPGVYIVHWQFKPQ